MLRNCIVKLPSSLMALPSSCSTLRCASILPSKQSKLNLIPVDSCNVIAIRPSTTFLTHLTAEQLWKGVTSVSNAGKKRGRGRGAGRKNVKDLNRGQIIGVGKINMLFPGLNAPIIRGRETLYQRKLPPDPDYEKKLIEIREKQSAFRRKGIHDLERGFSGAFMPGRWIGPPEPVNGEIFEGFDSKALRVKQHNIMCPLGRRRIANVVVAVGNKNGVAGFAEVTGKDQRASLRKARSQAGQRLLQIPLFENRTVIHDFYSKYHCTELFVYKRPPNYGVEGHKVIRALCEVIGIKDLTVVTEGEPRNAIAMTKAFFLGLIKQKSFQQMADEKHLHVVEFDYDKDNYPVIVASPSDGFVRQKHQIGGEEVLDFQMYLHNGNVLDTPPPRPPPYIGTAGWDFFIKMQSTYKSRARSRVQLIAKYGELKSHLNVWEEERLAAKRKEYLAEKESEASEEASASS